MRILLNRDLYTLKKKVTKVIIVTDQTKKREEGEKRVNRAAVIVAPTGSGDEEGKEGDADCGQSV